MNDPPFREGDFVWCAFPRRENPARPAASEHLGYVLGTAEETGSSGVPELVAIIAYTTSQPWIEETTPLGVFIFDREAAAALGQERAFVMDLRRLAFISVNADWFPRLAGPKLLVQGHMLKRQQAKYVQAVRELLTRHPQNVERLGNRRPGGRR